MALLWYTVVVDSHDIAAQARWWAETLDWKIGYEDDEEVVIAPHDATEDPVETLGGVASPAAGARLRPGRGGQDAQEPPAHRPRAAHQSGPRRGDRRRSSSAVPPASTSASRTTSRGPSSPTPRATSSASSPRATDDRSLARRPARLAAGRLDPDAGALPRGDRAGGGAHRGPAGWGEFGPFLEYAPPEASRWLAAAVEAAWHGWPDARPRPSCRSTRPCLPWRRTLSPVCCSASRARRRPRSRSPSAVRPPTTTYAGWPPFATRWDLALGSGSTPTGRGTSPRRRTCSSRLAALRHRVRGAAVRRGRGAARPAHRPGAQRDRHPGRGRRVDPQGGGPDAGA